MVGFVFASIVYSVLVGFLANSYIIVKQIPQMLLPVVLVFLLINTCAGILIARGQNKKIKMCCHGTILLICFSVSVVISIAYHIPMAIQYLPQDHAVFFWSLLYCVVAHFVIFWNGIICVYLSSAQLGLKMRVIGALCGMIPVANLICLFLIMKTTVKELRFETEREQINIQRKKDKVCATKYPILLVHGVFFRDTKFFNYWGRIPGELERNGASVYYGNQPSAASIADSAEFLKTRIAQIIEQTGAEKVNIIAHSKGGLDCRYAIAKLGIGDHVASLTTINTPHRGCLFADYLLNVIPADVKNKVADTYNSTLRKMGDAEPDFLAAVNDLTDAFCQRLDVQMPIPQGIYCQSVGSVLTHAKGGKFPLNLSYHLVKYFDGENDGLVSEKSFQWGEKYILLRDTSQYGISHGDMIDLNRANIEGFDVREFYVNLVHDLKKRGL